MLTYTLSHLHMCGFSTKELTLEQYWLELCESVKLWSVKKNLYKWSHAVQTHAVQELTVFELAEERNSELKDQLRLCKPKNRKKKRMKNNQSLRGRWGTSQCIDKCVLGVLGEDRRKIFLKIMAENSPNLLENYSLHILEAQRTPNWIYSK